MTYIEQQLVAHKDRILHFPAIALENFAIVIRPRNEIFEDCEAYQILHKETGRHVTTFSIAQPAIECLQKLETVAGFSGKVKFPLSKRETALINHIVWIAQKAELNHPEYLDWDELEYCCKEEEQCHY
jgi:hypothetical protein